MAASTTPRPKQADPPLHPVEAAIARLDPDLPLGVAFSGGADSTALLAACARRWPGQVHAIHVNHGLQAAASSFERQCLATGVQLGVPVHIVRVQAHAAPGESPQDAARQARYRALADVAGQHGLRAVGLAQHADDQVETLLLALSRGAGLPGLAGMAPAFERHGTQFVRPLLAVPGATLRDWVAQQGLTFVEDPSNADGGYTRNRIRQLVLPALAQALPQFRSTFARSAAHAAQAQEVLDDVARDDLAGMGGTPVIAALQRLPRARQANVLRHWLRRAHGAAASAAQLAELLDQVADCRTRGHRIRLRVGGGFVERETSGLVYRGSV